MSEEKKMVTITATFDVSVEDILRESATDDLSDAIRGELGWVHDSGIFLKDWDYLPEHTHPNGDQDSVCPVCGAQISYEDREIQDDGCICLWECECCGASGKLSEDIVFDQHFDIYDRNNNRVLKGRDEGIDGYTKAQLEKSGKLVDGAPEIDETTLKEFLAQERKSLEQSLFISIVREQITGPGFEHSGTITATSIFKKYVDAVEKHGTWTMAQEAACSIADLLEKGSISVSDLIALDDKEFLKLVEDTALESFENAASDN